MTAPRAVVIGGGIAGLATAALLARDGRPVTLLEQHGTLGGRAGRWETAGFRFDTGPSWYLMPEVFDHFFRLLGTSAAEQLDLVTLDPGYRVFAEDGRPPLDIRAAGAANRVLFESVEPGAGAALDRYLAGARETYGLAVDRFLYSTFASVRPLLSREVLARTGRLARLLLEPLDRYAARSVHDTVLRQILGYPAVFLGTSPDRAPSLYHLMSHLDLDDGVRYPVGGFAALIDRIVALTRAAGAELVTDARVTGIRTGVGGRRTSVAGVDWVDAEGRSQHARADIVVSAVDRHHTETELLPPALRRPDSEWKRRDPGPGAVLAMLGVRGELPQLTHHNLFFTTDWEANFERVFGADRGIPDPASLYVCKPSATDPGVAPLGHENLFVLVPVPADTSIGSGGTDGGGDRLVERTADAAIAQVAAWAGVPDLADRVVMRRTVGPGDFAADVNAWSGGALGPAHTLRQSAFLRPGNASRRVRGLFFAGATTIPGIGLPMCLISAELAVKRLRGDTSAGPLAEPLAPARAEPVR
ncbi:phytoene dehydrogenase [Leifsonia xyli subsp. cynodontis DSM 46306]|uniref:Amine oxidase domain-containing protein n=1 Tax=Leifsonia xyli subsp. cynodontis DSM 46306 TaxID=1389489 RepID=U3P7G0_LEIXC|nr:phytoene desaturase family protein [Leifsonia xyli]AGW41776.1 phytoene dehydrogenase [Leifsonia xyli subsp. cynodontis DSM 46306]